MDKKVIKILSIAFLALIFAISSAFAQGKGIGHIKKRPPGWDKGEKEGWKSDVPPGLENKDERWKKKSENKRKKKSKSKIYQEA